MSSPSQGQLQPRDEGVCDHSIAQNHCRMNVKLFVEVGRIPEIWSLMISLVHMALGTYDLEICMFEGRLYTYKLTLGE